MTQFYQKLIPNLRKIKWPLMVLSSIVTMLFLLASAYAQLAYTWLDKILINSLSKRSCLLKGIQCLIIFLVILSSSAYAQKTWNGNGNGNGDEWDRANNWLPNGVPGPSDIVVFNTGTLYPIKDVSGTVAQLQILGPGTIELKGSLTVSGNTTINSTSTLRFDNAAARTITINGNLSGGGTINMSGQAHILNLGGVSNAIGTLTSSTNSTVDYTRTGTQEVFASTGYRNLTISGTGTKTLQGNTTVAGNLTVSSTLAFATGAARTLDVNGNLNGTPNGTLDMTGGNLAHILNLSGTTNSIATLLTSCYSIINYSVGAGQLSNPDGNTRYISGTEGLTQDITECNVIIPVGATLNLNGFKLTVLKSLLVEGTLNAGTGAIVGAGSFTTNNGSVVTLRSPDGITTTPGIGNIQVTGTRDYAASTNFVFNRSGSQLTGNGFPLNIGSLTINTTSQVTLSNSVIVSAIVTINGALIYSNTSPQSLTVSGDLSGSGTINMSNQAHILNLAGANNTIGALTTSTTASTVNYNGTGNQKIFASANYRNLTISGSGIKMFQGTNSTINNNLTVSSTLQFSTAIPQTVNVNGNVSGAGTIDMSGGNLAHILNLAGANNAIGNLIPSCNSVVNYTGNGQQTFTNVAPIFTNYTVSGTVSLTSNIVVCNNLIVPVGTTLNLNGYTATVSGSTSVAGTLNAGNTGAVLGLGSFTLTGTLITASPNGIDAGTSVGSIRVSGTRTLTSGSFIYDGTVSQVTGNGLPATVVNITINNTSATPTVSLSQNLTISGLATFTAGDLSIGSNTLSLNGTTSVGSGTIIGGPTSNLHIGGSSGAITTLPFITNGLFNLTLNKTGSFNGATLRAGGNVMIYNGGSLNLLSGYFTNANTLTMGEDANALIHITRKADVALLLGGTPTFTGRVNVTYTGATTHTSQPNTGPELPLSATALNNLTIGNGSSILVTLSSTATPVVNGTFTINTSSATTGLFLNNRTLTINGHYVNTSFGTFTGSATSSLIITGDNKTVSGNIQFNQTIASNRSLQNFTLNRTGSSSPFTINTHAEISNLSIISGTLSATGTDIYIATATVESNGKFINNSSAYPVVLPSSTTTRAFNNNTSVAVNKFDRIGGTVTAFNNTDITFTGSGSPGSAYALRSRNLNPAPTAAIVRFELAAIAAGNQTNNAFLMLGNNFIEDGSRTNAAAIMRFNLRSGNAIRVTDGETGGTTSSDVGANRVWWVVNNSGGSLSYTGPDGTTRTIDNGRSDLWVGNTRVSNNIAISNTGIDLSEVKMVFDNGTGAITLKNLQINPIIQLVADMDCWYAGHQVNISVTANTAGGGGAFNAGTIFKVQRSNSDGTFPNNRTTNIVGTYTLANSSASNTFTIPATFPDLYSPNGTKDLGDLYRYRIITSDQNDPFVINAGNNKPMYYIINPGTGVLDGNNPTLDDVTATATGYTTSYWGYRLSSGASTIIPIANTGSSTYKPKLSDFPGTGEYYLVAVSSSGCISNQKKIQVNCSGKNKIVNGDFSKNTSGKSNDLNNDGILDYDKGDFYTEYTWQSTRAFLNQGWYAIDNNSNPYNGAFCNMTAKEHRAPTKDTTGVVLDGGRMLITDASPSGSKILWQQKIDSLKKNTNYVFTFWATSIDNAVGHNNTLQFGVYVNCYRLGDDITDNYAGPCNWVKYSIQFNTGNETELTLGIGNVSVAGSGNDVAIDNIEFYECADQTNVAFQPLNKFKWIGYTSNWFSSDNWGLCAPNLPTCADNVIIPSTLEPGRVYPIINAYYPDRTPDTWDFYKETNINGYNTSPGLPLPGAAAQVQNITIEPGAQLTINSPYSLRICGNMINDGTVAGAGTITFYGNTKQNISGTGTFANVAIDQGNSTTTALVQLTSDVTLSGELNIQKNSDELAINGKTLYFNGTLSTNPGTITGITSDPTTSTSAIIIGGTGNVNGTLKFTAGSQTLARLTMNRTGNGQVTLGTPLTLVGGVNALTLLNGIITTTNTPPNYLQMDEFSTVTGSSIANQISGGLNVSYINGPMVKVTKSTDVFTFPVGDGGYLGEIGIAPQNNNLNSFRAEYIRSQAFPGASVSPRLDMVSPFEYWKLDRINGNSSGKIALHWTSATNISLLPNDWSGLRVARYSLKADSTQEGTTIANGIWQSRGNSYISPTATASSGYIMSDMISQFSPYTFGTYSYIPLPVELLDIEAISRNGTITVQWITANEHNSSHFVLQRSGDGIHFSDIASLPAAGESKQVRTYSYLDKQPLQGINYYRLQQVDKDHTSSLSKIVSAQLSGPIAAKFEVYPNPSDGKLLYIQVPYKGEIKVTLFNMAGIEVYSQTTMADGSFASVQPATSLATGMYIVRVATGQGNYQQKLLVK